MRYRSTQVVRLSIAVVVISFSSLGYAAAIDEEAAKTLARDNDCFQCHSVDKTKKGPSYKKIAAKYKGKADAEEKIVKHLNTGPKVKLEDGTEEEHKIIKTKDMAQINNLVNWILSR